METLNFRPATSTDTGWLVNLRVETMSEYLRAAHEHLTHEDQKARVLQDFDTMDVLS